MNIEIANRLYELRKKSGLSQEELAERLGVSRQAVSKWERAEASPDTDNLILLSKIYNVSLDDILNSDDIEIENLKAENAELKKDNNGMKVIIKQNKFAAIIHSTIWLFATIAFLLVGFLAGLWHPYWTIFLMAVCINSLVSAITKKKPSEFAYPVLMVAVYIIVCYYTSLWGIMWVVFITIPIYYSIAGIISKGTDECEDDDDEDEEE
ncbi:MAG: helix-turn-helix transcriptional regulator [Gammaproteobacteria bacterium]|nr:helix-turn-helix transcriptional regulator [Gammaproteobacteria bacterium]